MKEYSCKHKAKEFIFKLEGARVNYPEQGQVYLAYPKELKHHEKVSVIIAIHGSGRNALSYKYVDFYKYQRDIALCKGYVFASISNDKDSWGLDDGLFNVNLLCNYLKENHNAKEKFALWGTSAGGVLMNRMVKEYPNKVNFLIGTFPVYDLLIEFNVLNMCRSAWGTEDKEEFMKLIQGKNPADFPYALTNHTYYISHGLYDAAVPAQQNSIRMRDEVNAHGGNINLDLVTGGHSTSNYNVYDSILTKLPLADKI